ncbi:hypothetical protein AcW1_001878 [Taiwanofungus camphoratus]|nr:hypothetical protein AcW1_001878 [Antrodia cinnamomea]
MPAMRVRRLGGGGGTHSGQAPNAALRQLAERGRDRGEVFVCMCCGVCGVRFGWAICRPKERTTRGTPGDWGLATDAGHRPCAASLASSEAFPSLLLSPLSSSLFSSPSQHKLALQHQHQHQHHHSHTHQHTHCPPSPEAPPHTSPISIFPLFQKPASALRSLAL